MKKFILYSFCILSAVPVFSQKSEIIPLVEFLHKQELSAKDYILELFKTKDIVILCERDHREITQYDLFWDVISDPYFVENVGAVYTEVGMDNVAPRIEALLMSEGLDSVALRKEVTAILRDANNEPYLWQCRSWPLLITKLYNFNRNLPPERKLHMYPVDHSVDWQQVRTKEMYELIDQEIFDLRDSVMAYNFVRLFESTPSRNGNKKALVIMNYRHAFLKHHHHSEDEPRENCAKYIHDVYGDRVASVMVNMLGMPESITIQDVVKGGLWDAAFELADKTNVGFDVEGTPFGEAPCDLSPGIWPIDGYRYQDVLTGMVYYLPIQEHILAQGWEESLDEYFKEEFLRRFNLAEEEEETELSQEFMDDFNRLNFSGYYGLTEFREKIDRWKE